MGSLLVVDCVLFIFFTFSFSTPNQVPQIIIKMRRLLIILKPLKVVICTTLKYFQKSSPSGDNNRFEILITRLISYKVSFRSLSAIFHAESGTTIKFYATCQN